MKTNFKFLMSFVTMLLLTISLWAQNTVKGKVVDAETGETIPGASVLQQGTSNGTSTDIDGNFLLQLSGKGKLLITFVGYSDKVVAFDATNMTNLGTITLSQGALGLDEVVVIGSGLIDVVKDRQTPIAVSTVPASIIAEKSGNQEFPEILKNTPSIQVAGQSGGYGDSRINVRGFKQDNTAYLLNGQPINGMEDGKMYWSNWSGMNDIANAVQVQRGLGSSKLAISSVGGTVNIVTKATEKRKGGFLRTVVGNDAFMKYTIAYNSGILDNKFGVSILLTHWQGDGYNNATKGQGQNYFLSLGWKPNEKHLFNFLVTGAPQWHDQNFTKPISDYLKYGKKYNNNWGYLNGEYYSTRTNFYHKPVMNLNWDWNISDASNLSTVLYASWGRGGGTGALGSASYTENGLIDLNKAYRDNLATDGAGGYKKGYFKRANVNSHQWFGAVTNFEHKLGDNWSVNFGADLRNYTGLHFRQIVDFLGMKSYTDSYKRPKEAGAVTLTESYTINPWRALTNYASEEQRYGWDYDETINYGGIFGQVEYNSDHLSAYFQGAVSKQTHKRTDRWQYLKGNQDSEKVTNNGYNVKGGLNYKVNEQHSFFVNSGFYSRQPYHDNIYLNYGNDVNPLTKNEKVTGLELGYQFKSLYFDANLNLYRTSWKDRVTTISFQDKKTKEDRFVNNSGVNQLHQGVEFDFKARPFDILTFTGFISYGNWEYQDDALKKTYDGQLNVIEEKVTDLKGGKVGDSPQFQMGIGFVLRPMDKLKFDMDWKYNDKLYADIVVKDNLELPSYNLFDAGVSYEEKIVRSDRSIKLRFNVNNLFDTEYISEIRGEQIFRGGETYKGIDVRNSGYFGFGRTWNVSATYRF